MEICVQSMHDSFYFIMNSAMHYDLICKRQIKKKDIGGIFYGEKTKTSDR